MRLGKVYFPSGVSGQCPKEIKELVFQPACDPSSAVLGQTPHAQHMGYGSSSMWEYVRYMNEGIAKVMLQSAQQHVEASGPLENEQIGTIHHDRNIKEIWYMIYSIMQKIHVWSRSKKMNRLDKSWTHMLSCFGAASYWPHVLVINIYGSWSSTQVHQELQAQGNRQPLGICRQRKLQVPSGKHTKNYGKSAFFLNKSAN